MIESLPELISVLGIVLSYFQAQKLDKDARVRDALEAMQEAIIETRKYIERANIDERDRSTELELSKLWGLASIKIKKLDPYLANRLELKSSYWENSANLSRREIHQNGIALLQVEKDFRTLRSRD